MSSSSALFPSSSSGDDRLNLLKVLKKFGKVNVGAGNENAAGDDEEEEVEEEEEEEENLLLFLLLPLLTLAPLNRAFPVLKSALMFLGTLTGFSSVP